MCVWEKHCSATVTLYRNIRPPSLMKLFGRFLKLHQIYRAGKIFKNLEYFFGFVFKRVWFQYASFSFASSKFDDREIATWYLIFKVTLLHYSVHYAFLTEPQKCSIPESGVRRTFSELFGSMHHAISLRNQISAQMKFINYSKF